MWEGITDFEQFLGRHRKKPDVVKATQEPRRTRQKGYGRVGTGSVSCNSVFVLHLCRFLHQEDLMERKAMVQNP